MPARSDMALCGTGRDVCCYVNGQRCPHLQPSARPGYVWDCGLMVKYGTWLLVHLSPEYLHDVKPTWVMMGVDDCGDYCPKRTCPDCGQPGTEE